MWLRAICRTALWGLAPGHAPYPAGGCKIGLSTYIISSLTRFSPLSQAGAACEPAVATASSTNRRGASLMANSRPQRLCRRVRCPRRCRAETWHNALVWTFTALMVRHQVCISSNHTGSSPCRFSRPCRNIVGRVIKNFANSTVFAFFCRCVQQQCCRPPPPWRFSGEKMLRSSTNRR